MKAILITTLALGLRIMPVGNTVAYLLPDHNGITVYSSEGTPVVRFSNRASMGEIRAYLVRKSEK